MPQGVGTANGAPVEVPTERDVASGLEVRAMHYHLLYAAIARLAILTCISALVLTGVSRAVVKDPAMMGVRDYDPLQHAHLILHGKIIQVTYKTRSGSAWGFGSGEMPLTTAEIEISVEEVLKGKWSKPTAVGYAFWSERKFEPNEEYIFCAKFQHTNIGQLLWIGELPGLYARQNEKWLLVERSTVPGHEAEILTTGQVKSRVRRASLASVVDSSDVVARGVVDSVWTSRYQARGNRFGVLEHRRLRVTTLLKGKLSDDHVEFVVPLVGPSFVPKWYRAVPRGMTHGTEWFVFLKNGPRGLHAFGGPNSMLQVKGNSLIYDGRISYGLSVEEATRAVQSAVHHTQD